MQLWNGVFLNVRIQLHMIEIFLFMMRGEGRCIQKYVKTDARKMLGAAARASFSFSEKKNRWWELGFSNHDPDTNVSSQSFVFPNSEVQFHLAIWSVLLEIFLFCFRHSDKIIRSSFWLLFKTLGSGFVEYKIVSRVVVVRSNGKEKWESLKVSEQRTWQ